MEDFELKLAWESCDPHKDTPLGKGCNYSKFITFVRWFLAPYMDLNFVEEKYYEEIWQEMWSEKNVVLQIARGHSKCISGDTRIMTSDGDWVKAKDYKSKVVQSLNNDLKIESDELVDFWSNGHKPVFLVKTNLGKEVKVTLNHPFKVLDGWKSIEDGLKAGEYIATPRIIPYTGKDTLTKEECRLMGYMVGDGNLTTGNKRFSNIDSEILSDMNKCLSFKESYLKHEASCDYRIKLFQTKKNSLCSDFFKKQDMLNKYSYNKTIPQEIFRQSHINIAEFLKALFSCDGYLGKSGRHHYIGITLANKVLIEEIEHLLLRFGIISIKSYKKNNFRGAYCLTLNGINMRSYMAQIGFIGKKAQRWEQTKEEIVSKKLNSNLDIIPISGREKPYYRDSNHIGRASLQKIARTEGHKLLANSDIMWEKITSIEFSGIEETFDLTTKTNHNFIGNNIFLHNTEIIGIWVTIYIAVYQPINPFLKEYRGVTKKMTEQLLIAGAGDDLNAWTDRIKDFFYKSPFLTKLKPEGIDRNKTSSKWNNKEMILKNGSTIHLRTMKGKIRGLHVDRVCADDLITESSTLTDRQTIDIWDGAVHGTTTAKEALINVIGTPLRFTDIQFHLKNKPEGYYFKARPAIIDVENKIVLAPNRRSYEDLMRVKADIGSTKFSTEYMLNPIDDSVSLIKREHMMRCLDSYLEGFWVKPIFNQIGTDITVTFEKLNSYNYKREDWDEVYVTGDFAFSDRLTADWCVFSYYGIKSGRAYKLGYIRGQGWSSKTQEAIIVGLHKYLKVTYFGLEENSIVGVRADLKALGLPIKLFWMAGTDPAHKKKGDPNYSFKRHSIGKVSSIERLDAAYESKKIILPYKTEKDKEMIDLQMQESVSWALENGKLVEIGAHPDIPITEILLNEMMGGQGFSYDFAIVGQDSDDNEERNVKKSKGIAGEGL